MLSAKRVIIATILGFIAGFLNYLGVKFGGKIEVGIPLLFVMLLNRTLIGFVIGISAFRINWAAHGILIGFIVGLPFSVGVFMGEGGVVYFFPALGLSAVWGFIIELFTSVVFKAKAVST